MWEGALQSAPYPIESMMIWFEHPAVSVTDWAKPGKIRQVSSVEAAAEDTKQRTR